MRGFELCEPTSVEAALPLLGDDDPGIRLLGGGTALMLMMKARLFQPSRLVSLRRVEDLRTIAFSDDGGMLRIGSAVTFTQFDRSEPARRAFPVLSSVMRTLSNIRVRNVATVGGNLAHADPHLDLPPLWTALDAEVRIRSRAGERALPVGDLISGYYETALAPDEILTELRLPVRPGWTSRYIKVTTRAAHDWPAIGLAISAHLDGRAVKDIRLVLGAAVDRPTRLLAAEEALRGREVHDADLRRACEAAVAEAGIQASEQGSAAYKRQLLSVHLRRGLGALLEEASS